MQQATQEILSNTLLDIIHYFHQKAWSPATSTNYSFRNPPPQQNTYTISRSGVDKGSFSLEDLMGIDEKGQPLPNFAHLKPSAETLLHTLLYEQSEINAVLHTHSVFSTVLSRMYLPKKGLTLEGWEVQKGLEGIHSHEAQVWLPIFPNAQDMQALSQDIRAFYQEQPSSIPAFLLAGHGLYAWGKDLATAKRHIETVEFLLECHYRYLAAQQWM